MILDRNINFILILYFLNMEKELWSYLPADIKVTKSLQSFKYQFKKCYYSLGFNIMFLNDSKMDY